MGKDIKKEVLYSSQDHSNFELLEAKYKIINGLFLDSCLEFYLCNPGTSFYLSSPEEIDEFCELLQEKKKEIWK